jgi:hypothetical protein
MLSQQSRPAIGELDLLVAIGGDGQGAVGTQAEIDMALEAGRRGSSKTEAVDDASLIRDLQ